MVIKINIVSIDHMARNWTRTFNKFVSKLSKTFKMFGFWQKKKYLYQFYFPDDYIKCINEWKTK